MKKFKLGVPASLATSQKNRKRKRLRLTWAELLLLLAGSLIARVQGQANTDHCDGLAPNWVRPRDTDSCMQTREGIRRDNSYVQENCNYNLDYMYREIEIEPIRTMLFVTHFLDIQSGNNVNGPSISFGFIAENPPTIDSTEDNWPSSGQAIRWYGLGWEGLTRLIDLSDQPVFGKYLVLKYTCDSAQQPCTKIEVQLVQCWSETLLTDGKVSNTGSLSGDWGKAHFYLGGNTWSVFNPHCNRAYGACTELLNQGTKAQYFFSGDQFENISGLGLLPGFVDDTGLRVPQGASIFYDHLQGIDLDIQAPDVLVTFTDFNSALVIPMHTSQSLTSMALSIDIGETDLYLSKFFFLMGVDDANDVCGSPQSCDPEKCYTISDNSANDSTITVPFLTESPIEIENSAFWPLTCSSEEIKIPVWTSDRDPRIAQKTELTLQANGYAIGKHITWILSDNQDATYADTRTHNLRIKILSHNSFDELVLFKQTFTYTNECQTDELSPVANPSKVVSLTTGEYTAIITELDPLISSNCGSTRQYAEVSIVPDGAGDYIINDVSDNQMTTQLAKNPNSVYDIQPSYDLTLHVYHNIADTQYMLQEFTIQINVGGGDLCTSGARTASYPNINPLGEGLYELQVRQASYTLVKPESEWDSSCTEVVSQGVTLFDQNMDPIAGAKEGVTINADYTVTLYWEKGYSMDAFYVRYTEIRQNSYSTDTFEHTCLIQPVDNCGDAALTGIYTDYVKPDDMEVTILGSQSQDVDFGGDTPEAQLYRGTDRWAADICGPIKIQLDASPTSILDFASIKSNGPGLDQYYILVEPLSDSPVSSDTGYLMTLRIYLEEYMHVFIERFFKLKVLDCQYLASTEDSSITSLLTNGFSFNILQDPALTINTHYATYTPECGYSSEYTISANPPINVQAGQNQFYTIDSSTGVVTIDTVNLLNAGSYQLTRTRTLINYPHEDTFVDRVASFTLTLVDPCQDAKLIPEMSISPIHLIVGVGESTNTFPSYKDDISLQYDHANYPDLDESKIGTKTCGPRSYSLFDVTNFNEATNQGYLYEIGAFTDYKFAVIHELPESQIQIVTGTNVTSDVGYHRIMLKATLSNLASSDGVSSTFEVTYYVQSMDLTMSTVQYELGQGPFEVLIPQLLFTPGLVDDPSTDIDGTSYLIEAFIISAEAEETLPSSLGHIYQVESDAYLVVHSSDSTFVGEVTIKLIYNMQDYLEGQQLETQVKLQVSPQPPPKEYILGPKPGFDLTGVKLFQTITAGEAWQFELPPTTHESEKPIDIRYDTVDYKSAKSFIDYNQQDQVMSIEEGVTGIANVGKHTISIRLVDADGMKSDWLKVQLTILAAEEESIASEESSSESQTAYSEAVGQKYAAILADRVKNAGQSVEQQQIPPPPRASISEISPVGLVKITFTNEMIALSDNIRITPDGILLTEEQSGRLLSSEVVSSDGFRVKIIPADGSQEQDLEHDWNIQTYSAYSMELKLDFEKPLYVSSNPEPDTIEITFKSEELFLDKYNQPLASDTKLIQKLPKMAPSEGQLQLIEQTEGLVQSGTQTVLIANFILQFLQGASLQYMWDMINAQQLIIILPLFDKKIVIPTNASIIFGAIMSIAAFEAIPTDMIYETWSTVEGRPRADRFEELGFEHHLLLNNFGTLGFVLACLPFVYFYEWSLRKCCLGIKWCKRRQRNMFKSLYWGTIIRLIIESFIIGMICVLINMRELDFTTIATSKWTYWNSLFTCIFLPIFALFPFLGARYMYYSWHQLKTKEEEQRFGEVYAGYNLDSKAMIVFWFMDYVRKFMLAFAVVIYQEQLWLQVFILFMSSIFMIIANGYIRVKQSSYDQKMDAFNELKLIIITYHLMVFTEFGPDPETKFLIGYSCCVSLILGTAINMIMLVKRPFAQLKRRWVMRYHKSKAQKEREAKKINGKKFHDRRCQMLEDEIAKYTAQVKELKEMKAQILEQERQEKLEKERKRAQYLLDLENKTMEQKKARQERRIKALLSAGADQEDNGPKKKYRRLKKPKQPAQDDVKDEEKQNQLLDDVSPLPRDYSIVNEQSQDEIKLSDRNEVKSDQHAYRKGKNPKRFTWDDLDVLWKTHGVGLDAIIQKPGYEDIEVIDEEDVYDDEYGDYGYEDYYDQEDYGDEDYGAEQYYDEEHGDEYGDEYEDEYDREVEAKANLDISEDEAVPPGNDPPEEEKSQHTRYDDHDRTANLCGDMSSSFANIKINTSKQVVPLKNLDDFDEEAVFNGADQPSPTRTNIRKLIRVKSPKSD